MGGFADGSLLAHADSGLQEIRSADDTNLHPVTVTHHLSHCLVRGLLDLFGVNVAHLGVVSDGWAGLVDSVTGSSEWSKAKSYDVNIQR